MLGSIEIKIWKTVCTKTPQDPEPSRVTGSNRSHNGNTRLEDDRPQKWRFAAITSKVEKRPKAEDDGRSAVVNGRDHPCRTFLTQRSSGAAQNEVIIILRVEVKV